MKKHLFKIIIGILVLFVITNPTQTDFKNSIGYGGHRTLYLLFFSIYKSENAESIFEKGKEHLYREKGEEQYGLRTVGHTYIETTYIGIFKNFINIGTKQWYEVSKNN